MIGSFTKAMTSETRAEKRERENPTIGVIEPGIDVHEKLSIDVIGLGKQPLMTLNTLGHCPQRER